MMSVDMERLERDVRSGIRGVRSYPATPEPGEPPPDFIPRPPKPAEPVPTGPKPSELTKLQIIAREITRLTWHDAEAMGKGIGAKETKGESTAGTLTAAIQAWARETFAHD
jgi:hypothetical protein